MGEFASQQHAIGHSTNASKPTGVTDSSEPFIAADVGGTHARIGLVLATSSGRQPVSVLHSHRYRCADWPDLGTILDDFMAQPETAGHTAVRQPVHCGVVACAGRVLDDAIINENLPWPVSISALRSHAGLTELDVINDFDAVARAAQFLDVDDTRPVIEPAYPSASGPVLVMGPGTGLGSAVLLPQTGRAQVLPTEAGQISLAPGNEREIEILRVLARGGRRVSFEDVLSGPGLTNLYRVLSELRGEPATLALPADISAAALVGSDATALETLEVFCALLGSFAGDLAMLYGTSGGVFLAGGILPQIHGFLRGSRFTERFLDKGAMRAFLQQIPVRLIEHGQLGVIGAASWFLEERRGQQPASPH